MFIDSINNDKLLEPQISKNNNVSPNHWEIIPPEVIRPDDEHIFNISLCNKQFRVIVVNETSFTMRAGYFIDEGCPVLMLKKEGGSGSVPFIGLDNKDQTIRINESFLRKYHM